MSASEEAGYFGDGLAEEILNALGRYRDARRSFERFAEEVVVHSGVRELGGRVEVTG